MIRSLRHSEQPSVTFFYTRGLTDIDRWGYLLDARLWRKFRAILTNQPKNCQRSDSSIQQNAEETTTIKHTDKKFGSASSMQIFEKW